MSQYKTAITELRQLLGDSEFHKKATRKKLIGKIDGTNQTFFSYDKRILEDTLEVFINNELVSASVESSIQGKIIVSSAPEVNQKIDANYYWIFFLDEELVNFLNKGAEGTGQFTSEVPDQAYLAIQPGLKNAALYFAASMAVSSLMQYMMNRRHSEEFLVEQDGNDDSNFSNTIDAMRRQSKDLWDKAVFHRDDFFKRTGKRNAPAFAIKTVRQRNYGPKR